MSYRHLRPPGALPEPEFLKRCLQCGQCAAACPFRSIKLLNSPNPLVAGTPVVEPREVPCWLCMRCPEACPSGALKPVAKEKAGMGKARLVKDLCFTYEGTVICRSCFERCPLKGSAIILERAIYPVVTDDCVGCGVCEHVCPRKAIETVPERWLDLWWSIRSLFYTDES